MCLPRRQIFYPYMFCIARGHFCTGKYFRGKCLPVCYVHVQVVCLSFVHHMCLSRRLIFYPYMFCIARGHLFTGTFYGTAFARIRPTFRGCFCSVTQSLTSLVTQTPNHPFPTQAPSHSPPTQAPSHASSTQVAF